MVEFAEKIDMPAPSSKDIKAAMEANDDNHDG